MTSRHEVYAAIDGERLYQDTRWNPETTPSNGIHPVGSWLTFIRSYLREAEDILSRNADPKASEGALDILRKIVGMGVACMEQNGVVHRGSGVSGYTAVAERKSGSIGWIIAAARGLRAAQRDYLADRGNEELGQRVGKWAAELDTALGDA
jgi:hypothetical protein